MNNEQKKILEEFLLDIDILDKLDGYMNKFNVFDVLKISKMEIRHSNMLAWLLNPKETHGLGDTFLRKFLQHCAKSYNTQNNDFKIDIIKASLMDCDDFLVSREWNNIDVLLVSSSNKIVICLENKIFSKESKHQLKKYLDIVNKRYPDYKKAFIFLTPEGDMPSDEENWISVNYSEVLSMLESSMELKKEYINPSVEIFLEQYKHMIRRDIIMDEELVAICTEIYNKHQKALDLIYEYKQDNDMQIKKIIEDILAKYDDIEMDHSNKSFIRFYTKTIDNVIPKCGEGWTKSNRILLYEFQNKGGKIVLKLIIGPVKDNDTDIRERVFELASENKNIFKGKVSKLTPKYTQIYAVPVISKEVMEGGDMEAIGNDIDTFVSRFVNEDMKKVDDIIKELL